MRRLEVLQGASADELMRALRGALGAAGPAVLPRQGGGGGGDDGAGGGALAQHPPLPSTVAKTVALVVETSGSTGTPKRVALSTGALLASATAVESELGGAGQWLLALPTHYIAGAQVLVRSIVAGTEPIVMPAGHFDARTFAVGAAELTSVLRFSSVVPAQLARLVEAAEGDAGIRSRLQTLDALLIGGQSAPAPLFDRALELGLNVKRTYGSSETAGGCVYDGHPIGHTLARATNGEIELAGPMLADGYLGDPELTDQKFYTDAGHRWYRTADGGEVVDAAAAVDPLAPSDAPSPARQAVVVTGRLDNVIISGGIKVSLDRVERVVQAQPGYGSAIVVAQASERWGQSVAVVMAGPERSRSSSPARSSSTSATFSPTALAELQDAVTAALGRPAAPAALVIVPTLPMLSSGKPDRVAAARLVAGVPAEGAPDRTPGPGQ